MVIIPDIFVGTLDRKESYVFPTLPEEFPDIELPSKNEEFVTFNAGNYNLTGGAGLKTFSMGYMLPMHDYSFNGWDYHYTPGIIKFLTTSMINKTPVEFVFIEGDVNSYTIIIVLVEKFTYRYDKMLDIVFSGDFKEYKVIP